MIIIVLFSGSSISQDVKTQFNNQQAINNHFMELERDDGIHFQKRKRVSSSKLHKQQVLENTAHNVGSLKL